MYDVFAGVPTSDIEVLPFDVTCHHPEAQWFDRRTNRQRLRLPAPSRNTAWHICLVLPSKPPEFVAAYKLYAFAREHELEGFASAVLAPVFAEHGTALHGWWNGNSKYVLPADLGYYPISRFDHEYARKWSDFVTHAALLWQSIAEHWAIIRIPQLMDPRSPEYEEYETARASSTESVERREYERLKQRFEESSP